MRKRRLTLMIASFVALAVALACQQPLHATADRGKDYPSCASPSWSGDGQWIAFASDHAGGKYHVWKVRATGADLTQVTPSGEVDSAPAWSRDGEWIAFSRAQDGNTQIWVVRPDGSQPARVTTYPCLNVNPAWAPDNATLAFVTDRADDWDILTASLAGEEGSYLVASAKRERHPTWAPDGSWIAYARSEVSESGARFSIWKARVGSNERVEITTGQHMEWDPAWHPTQNLIAFDSDRDGSRKLWVVNADGTGLHRVTSRPMSFVETEPAWSPDGSKLAFIGERQYGGEVWIVNADGTGLTQVTHLTEPQP